ncbi:MAG: SDR family oxidoreductase [Xanthomonadales bacterium]|jgi:NAD(P)-dependent dehydrogenase (short-subunit alcohol dehydrogenase family)|nr:SDR family oxidoreductase [Xanthomonadales bacterium]
MTESSTFRPDLMAGRNVFITGGSSGINLGIAECFLQHGARVTINGRDPAKLAAAVEHLKGFGAGPVLGVDADVRDYAALSAAIAESAKAHGPIDVLVCGAAGNFPALAEDLSPNGFKAVVDIDLIGTFHTCRAAFAHLRKPGAAIINISAPQAAVPFALQAHVCAAKAGVDMLTRTLAIEWGPHGIRVNSIVPGPIAGTEGLKRLTQGPDSVAKVVRTVPLNRLGQTHDIGHSALFLASPAASYVSGTVLFCDGGHALVGSGMILQAAMS